MFRAPLLLLGTVLILATDQPHRRPLDLPSGGNGPKEEREYSPETIEFFGGEYEGDAFMFVIDVSGSMGSDGRLETAQDELTQALMSLSSEAEFGIVSFSNNLNQFSLVMEEATLPNKTSGVAWLTGLEPMGGTCIDLGTIHGLDILRTTEITPENTRLILLGDGAQGCGNYSSTANEEALENIMVANWEQVSIDTLLIGNASEEAIWLFENIAQHNSGEFRIVN